MTPLVLELRARVPERIDMREVTPDRLQGLSPSEIARVEIWAGAAPRRLGDLYALSGDDPSELLLRGETACADYIGAGLRAGRITVEGDAGDYLGREMRGGEIRVRGHAGAYAGCGLRDGTLHIEGNAGDFLGAAQPGDRHGMRGGTVVVRGHAGDRVGERQRRGQILIAGDAGDYLGARMLAGTIVVLGQIGRYAGIGMRRGTLLLAKPPPQLPTTFNENGRHHLSFLALFIRSLHGVDDAFARLDPSRTGVRRFVGDLACNGKGEVLVWM